MDQRRVVIAFDPGITTGTCSAQFDDDDFTIAAWSEVPYDHRFDYIQTAIRQAIDHDPFGKPTIVVEEFRLRADAARAHVNDDFKTIQVIGVIQCLVKSAGLDPDDIVMLPPAVKGRIEIRDLDQKGLGGAREHGKDAYKLLRYWYLQKRNKQQPQGGT